MNNNAIIQICEVKSVIDDTDGMRIKVRMTPYDNNIAYDDDLPYAFPLLPKMLHITPKVGECVLIILGIQGDKDGNRYYIGPVISQPQMMKNDPYNFSATSLLKGNNVLSPMEAPSSNPNIDGSMPDFEDVAIEGRSNSDIILKDNELRIRCGFKETPDSSSPKNMYFNKINPAFIQMKYVEDKLQSENGYFGSAINIVSDKINFISHQSKNNYNVTDSKDLISDSELIKIVDELHPAVYGDKLVEFLKLFLNAFMQHSHAFPMDPPTKDNIVNQASTYNLDEINSKSVKLN